MRQEKLAPAAARYETGLRMRRFEQLWEAATPEQKRQALPLVNQAVMGFFAGGPAASAKPLDQAILRLSPALESVWGRPLVVTPHRRMLDSAAGKVTLTVSHLYEIPDKAPRNLEFFVSGKPGTSLHTAPAIAQPLMMLPQELTYPFPEIEDDATLFFEAHAGADQSENVGHRLVTIALVKNLKARLAMLEGVTEPSVVLLREILKKLASGEPLETDYPGLKLLQAAEAGALGKPSWGNRQVGQFWLSLTGAPVRLLAPKAVESGKPLPLVLALHGAGGSENLFFDGYGDGKLVRLCEKQGWLLLATRNGQGTADLPRLLDALERLYPIDRKRVFLVGHSMGAAMGSQLVSRNPGVFTAAALLGGGGVVGEKEKLPKLFVAAGASDFGRTGAERLAQAAGVACKVYPNCEHLTVVQEALADVIAFFERA